SVEAGDVLAGILAAARSGDEAGLDHRHSRESGNPVPFAQASHIVNSFPARHIHLTRGYRQSAALDLAPLAAAVRDGDSDTALSLLHSGELSGVHFHEGDADVLQSHRDHLLEHWTALAEASDPAEALARAGRLR